jgi:hypothetical protein
MPERPCLSALPRLIPSGKEKNITRHAGRRLETAKIALKS